MTILEAYKEQKKQIVYNNRARNIVVKYLGKIEFCEYYSETLIDINSEYFNDKEFWYFYDEITRIINSENVIKFVLLTSIYDYTPLKMPSIVLYYENKIKVVFPKVNISLSGEYNVIKEIEIFEYNYEKFKNLKLYVYNDNLRKNVLCYKFKKFGLFKKTYYLLTHEFQVLIEDFLNRKYMSHFF